MNLLIAVVNGGSAAWNGAIYAQSHNTLNLVACTISAVCTVWMLISATRAS